MIRSLHRQSLLWLLALLLWSNQPTPLMAASSCTNFVAGAVFLDLNGNGERDQDEPYTSGHVRLVQEGQTRYELNAEAEFGFVFSGVVCGAYQVFLDDAYVADVEVSSVIGQSLTLSRAPYRIFLPSLQGATTLP